MSENTPPSPLIVPPIPPSRSSPDTDSENPVLTSVMNTLMQGVVNSSSKRKHQDDSPTDANQAQAKKESYNLYGRAFTRIGDLFNSVDTIVQHGINHEIEDTDDERTITDKERALTESWNILCRLIPRFRQEMIALAEQRKVCKSVACAISRGVNNVRAEDSASLKPKILQYLLADVSIPLEPTIRPAGLKTDRGWAHPVTAALLCPLEYPATQRTYDDIRAGSKSVLATQLPRFLYPDGRGYDEDDLETGLLEGHVLVRISKHILQGPTAALEADGFHRGQGGNAAITGQSEMTPRCVAYMAVQARFAMSSTQIWAKLDGEFNYETFFWLIVSIFEDGAFDHVLQKFNRAVFGCPDGATKVVTENTQPTPTSDLDRIRAQRAAKKARATAPPELDG